MNRFLKPLIPLTALVFSAVSASAVPVYGGSDLLGAGDAALLQQWLGEGNIGLTNIFDKEVGDTAQDFHAAVDNQGATFTLIEVLGNYQGDFNTPIVIGGYNPFSWGGYGYNSTPEGQRDAFLFNLTSDTVAYQHPNGYRGLYQTYNHLNYGPTFGNGHDLYVNGSLTLGYTWAYAYGEDLSDYGYGADANILGEYGLNLRYGQIEVFAVDAAAVPEPTTLAIVCLGILGLIVTRRSAPALYCAERTS